MNRWRISISFALLLTMGAITLAQKTGSAPGNAAELLSQWNDIGRKLIAMAEDFPEERYGYKPTSSVRSFDEQLLHMAGSNYLFTNAALAQAPPGPDSESPEKYKTKAEVVAYVKKCFADGAAAIRSRGDAGLNQIVKNPEGGRPIRLLGLGHSLVEHSGEHYGQLVVYYRMAGLVPPESRPRK
jgi:uncharacterized damage-inducible protein DinB